MHTYGGITPLNVWDFPMETVTLLVEAAEARVDAASQ